MYVRDIRLGLRVRVESNDLIALIVGQPEHYTPSSKLVRIKYENSTRYEYVTNKMIEPLPDNEQYPIDTDG